MACKEVTKGMIDQLRTASPQFKREFDLIATCLDRSLAHLKEQQAKAAALEQSERRMEAK